MVLSLLALALVGVGAFALTRDGGDETEVAGEGAGSGSSRDDGDSDGGQATDPDADGGAGSVPTTEPSAPTTTVVPTTTVATTVPAQASVGDCVAVDTTGSFLGVGSCSDGGAPYKVVDVVDSPDACSAESWYTSSGDQALCMEVNVLLNYCYVFPKGATSGGLDGWITAASDCHVPGTVHVVDLVAGATNGDSCTQTYEWNYWYELRPPQMVACVMEY